MRLASRFLFCIFLVGVSVLGVHATSWSQEPGASKSAPGELKQAIEIPSAPQPVGSGQTSGPQGATDPPSSPAAQPGNISGTVTDTYGDVVPGATVALEGANAGDRKIATANDNGFFDFADIEPGIPFHIAVNAKGFADWASPPIVVADGQFFDVTGIKLRLTNGVESVVVTSSTEQIAAQQVLAEEHQRVFGFIPNFYVVYDSQNAVALPTKLKFQLALRTSIDPVSITGAAFMSGIKQAADTPDYVQGAKGYGQRFGAEYTDAFTDILFGGAILPSLFHQDPRYFYQGSGTIKSRVLHAMSNPFIARGDNGHLQPNISSIGGDLISSAISNAYYPGSNRGVSFTFQNLAIDTAERTATSLVQEFLLRKLTPSSKREN
jgi:hypothetical protein